MRLTTEDFAQHDACERLRTWSAAYELPRIPLAQAMHLSLRAGLIAGDPSLARSTLMGMGAQPGLDIEAWNLYEIAVHHAALMEIVCAYLLCDGGAWTPAPSVSLGAIDFEPLSYLLPDGRLRRVVLCSTWNKLREQEEAQSWWTQADISATHRPMLLNIIVIGNSIKGFRPTPWTRAYIHPENRVMRVKKREGNFTEKWERLYRESTDKHAKEWLDMMAQDGAFDDLVYSLTVDAGEKRQSILDDMFRMAKEMAHAGTDMRRSACFKMAPCPMARLCHHPRAVTPQQAGWDSKPTGLRILQEAV
jgi:hypothetical protein